MRKALVGSMAGRGVWVAPFLGPNGETILVAIRRDGCRITERLLAPGDDHVGAGDELWGMVEQEDPERFLKAI